MKAINALRSLDLSQWTRWLLAAAAVTALIIVMARVWPVGADYYYHRQPLVESFLAGETRLYDGHGPRFRLAPWSLLVLIPLSLLPLSAGQAVLNTMSLVGMMTAFHALREDRSIPFWAMVLAVANLHTFDLLIRGGKFDAIVMTGVALCWWAIRDRRPLLLSFGLWLTAIKPLNAILPALLFLYAIRKWPLSHQLQALSLPVLSALAFGFVIGFDWPWRYLTFNQGRPPNDYLSADIWGGASQLGLPTWPLVLLTLLAVAGFLGLAWRVGLSKWSLSVALATNLAFTPYANDSHFVVLIPAFIFVARHDWRLALLAYLTTWTPLLRLIWGFSASSIDIVYPFVLLVASWLVGLQGHITKRSENLDGLREHPG